MSRTKRLNQENSFIIVTPRNTYCVVLERLHNDPNGNARYHAVLSMFDKIADGDSCYNAVYNFTGHYISALSEARWIVQYYETENPLNY